MTMTHVSEAATPTWNDAVRAIFADQYALMVRKQQDYGPGNIAAFGELGVLVRLSDKLERLKHLLVTTDAAGQVTVRSAVETANEAVEDSYRDLLNYALIALMLRQGAWARPFRAADATLCRGSHDDTEQE